MNLYSSANNLQLIYDELPKKKPIDLSPAELVTMNIIKECRAVIAAQLEFLWGAKSKNKLKTMAVNGLLNNHVLISNGKKINIYTLPSFFPKPEKVIKDIVLAQLYTKIRKYQPCSIFRGDLTLLSIDKALFPVFVLRHSEKILTPILKGLPRVIIITEKFKPEKYPIPVRITTDEMLFKNDVYDLFLTPDGKVDRAAGINICGKK